MPVCWVIAKRVPFYKDNHQRDDKNQPESQYNVKISSQNAYFAIIFAFGAGWNGANLKNNR